MNTIGQKLALTTFGESHGVGIGGILDGVPSGIKIDMELIRHELALRCGGRNIYSTQRKEEEDVQILSGVMDGVSTGTSIGFYIPNTNTKSKDYESIKDIFRPGHADYTYHAKYGIRDYRGGGRSSARESAVRVVAGSIASSILARYGMHLYSGIYSIGDITSQNIDYGYAKSSEIFALDKNIESKLKDAILDAKNSHDSIGGVAKIKVANMLKALGEPLYDKLDGRLGDALLGLNGVKAIEIGDGIASSRILGSKNNDALLPDGFSSNHSGGILGGISNGDDLEISVYFKPTPSIFLPQDTINTHGEKVKLELKGRHDPCIAIRGSIVAKHMVALVLADLLLLNATAKIENLDKIYKVKYE